MPAARFYVAYYGHKQVLPEGISEASIFRIFNMCSAQWHSLFAVSELPQGQMRAVACSGEIEH